MGVRLEETIRQVPRKQIRVRQNPAARASANDVAQFMRNRHDAPGHDKECKEFQYAFCNRSTLVGNQISEDERPKSRSRARDSPLRWHAFGGLRAFLVILLWGQFTRSIHHPSLWLMMPRASHYRTRGIVLRLGMRRF